MEPYRFQDIHGKWGMITSDLSIACPALYDRVSVFGISRYKVNQERKVGVVDGKGTVLIPIEFDDVLTMQTHFFLAKKGKDVYLFDCFGTKLLDHAIKTAEAVLENGQLKIVYMTLEGQRLSKLLPLN
jgi:hypothetical protein